eukprot:2743111-Prymnesium_polylepis.1
MGHPWHNLMNLQIPRLSPRTRRKWHCESCKSELQLPVHVAADAGCSPPPCPLTPTRGPTLMPTLYTYQPASPQPGWPMARHLPCHDIESWKHGQSVRTGPHGCAAATGLCDVACPTDACAYGITNMGGSCYSMEMGHDVTNSHDGQVHVALNAWRSVNAGFG